MTINIRENIRKMMGWCPNTNAIISKRMFVTLPVDEEMAPGEKGRNFYHHTKMSWGNRYRNFLLIVELSILMIQVLFLLLDPESYFEFVLNFFLMGYPLNIIFAAFFMGFQWRYLNRIKSGNIDTTMKEKILWGFIMAFFFLSGIYAIVAKETLPSPFDFVYYGLISSGFIDAVFLYPLIICWERKNMMTIYLIEEQRSKWRPVARPVQTDR